jgi:uncharacterized protein
MPVLSCVYSKRVFQNSKLMPSPYFAQVFVNQSFMSKNQSYFMKKSFFIALFYLFAQSLWAQVESDSAFIRNNFDKQEIYITMRDGIRLFTTIYTPRNVDKPVPMLLKRTPYTVAPYGKDTFIKSFQNMYLARSGYIMVFQDVRGRWMSEGDFVDVRPINPNKKSNKDIDESTDTYDTIDWLVKNVKNNNGRVGTYGISYPGFYASCSAVDAHPALKAVSPQAPVTDWFIGDDFHHGGAFFMMDAFEFYYNFGRPHPKPLTPAEFKSRDLTYPDNYDFYLKMGALPNYTRKMGDSVRFWNDLMAHPNLDDFWKARSIRQHFKNIKPAMLTVGGLFDAEDCYGAWHTYEALERQNTPSVSNRIVMGPWFHGGWGGRSTGEFLGNVPFHAPTSDYFQKNIEAKFFNFYLKDEGSIADLPEASIFETGTNKWTNYTTWPPQNVALRDLFLQPNGGLSNAKPSGQAVVSAQNFTEWIADPARPVPYTEDVGNERTREYMIDDQRFASRRPDVLTFQTDVLTEDLTVTGAIDAYLQFSTTGTDADLVVKVIDVLPDDEPQWVGAKVPLGGYQMLVRGEILRGRFRNSFEKPEAFAPSKITPVKMQLPDIAHTFKKGHRLMVQIQSSWFPLVDRNPQKFVNIYQAKDSDFQKATHRIYHNAAAASRLVLPVLQR